MINGATIVDAPSAFSPTAGTTTNLDTLGIRDGKQRVVTREDATYSTRRTYEFSSVEARINSNSATGYTPLRNKVIARAPISVTVAGNDILVQNQGKIELTFDMSTTTAQKQALRESMAQLLLDSDFTEFWEDGSIA